MPPQQNFDWNSLLPRAHDPPAADPRRRLRWLLALYAAALCFVLLRAVQLELSDGESFRRLAAQTPATTVTAAAPRGRILARDGTVLAADRESRALAVHFRYLQSPPDARWLRRRAFARLTRADRRKPEQVAAAEQAVRDELDDLARRLARLCGIDEAEWRARAGRIQARVTALAERVNRRRRERFGEQTSAELRDAPSGLVGLLAGLFAPPEPLPPAEVIVAEQVAWHEIVDEVPPEVCAAIEHNPAAFPGVRIVPSARRRYPHESLAANILGHVGPPALEEPNDESGSANSAVGLMGIELVREARLRGRPGRERHISDSHGRAVSIEIQKAPLPGSDVILSLDPALQGFAEQLLDRLAGRSGEPGGAPLPRGGAIIVLDVHSGEVLTAASEPRFDPNWFVAGDPRIGAVLADPRRPMFDRATKMALAPGSVFKPLVALALVEHKVVDPQESFHCQGYLDEPDSMRCRIFRHQGIGHGNLTPADALAQSCNVYFFHHAVRLGAARLVDCADHFGFGKPPASDFAEQAAGRLPAASELRADRRLQLLAIGQGTITATPLQVARLYAAIANGGTLPDVRFTREDVAPPPADESRPPEEFVSTARQLGVNPGTLAAVREGLRRVVEDPQGTAHHSLHMPEFPVAGKTGTAETTAGDDHAWFAGYAPADRPRYAFVVVLEHGGSGAAAAVVARSLIDHMRHVGYFPTTKATTAQQPFPPGKG